MSNNLAIAANNEYALAEKSAHDALTHARKAGEALVKAKADQDHGHWLAWLAEHWHKDERTAQRLMRLHENWDALPNTTRMSDLSLNESLRLLSNPPKPRLDPPKPDPKATPEAPKATVQPSDDDVAQLQRERDDAFDRAEQAASRLEAVQIANAGADHAAKRIVALEQENAALKQDVARLQGELVRWKHKCKQLAGVPPNA